MINSSRSGRKPMRRAFVSPALSIGLAPLLVACTLTSAPFEPEGFVPGLGSDAGGSPALPGSGIFDRADAGVVVSSPGCLGTSELPGCELPLAPLDECESDLECESRVCAMGSCASPSCNDGRRNGNEDGVDCGEECGASCAPVTECEGVSCPAQPCGDAPCPEPTCSDEQHNQDEAATDCGGSCPNDCAVGQACATGVDCQSGVCAAVGCPDGVERCCQSPSCSDGVLNGTEPVVDCGDATCGSCALGRACTSGGQCATGLCDAGVCVAPSCTDEAHNGTESDVDCGGGCDACASGLGCNTDADCESSVCQDGRCCGGREVDCTRCARRLVSVLACDFSTDPLARDQCNAFLDCLADNAAACPVRHASGCSDDPGGVCNHTTFGGNGGPGLALADNILGTASCLF